MWSRQKPRISSTVAVSPSRNCYRRPRHFPLRGIGQADDSGIVHLGVCHQIGLYLQGRDVNPPGLDEVFQAPTEMEAPHSVEHAEIACTEVALSVKRPGIVLRVVVIPWCHIPGNQNLADFPGGRTTRVSGWTIRSCMPGSGFPWECNRTASGSWASVTVALPYVSVAP